MIIKTELEGGYVWIEHDDKVGVADRIFTLCTAAPGHAPFALGSAVARDVGQALSHLTAPPQSLGKTCKEKKEADPYHWCSDCPGAGDEIHTGDDELLDTLTSIRVGLETIRADNDIEELTEAVQAIEEDCGKADRLRIAELKARRP